MLLYHVVYRPFLTIYVFENCGSTLIQAVVVSHYSLLLAYMYSLHSNCYVCSLRTGLCATAGVGHMPGDVSTVRPDVIIVL